METVSGLLLTKQNPSQAESMVGKNNRPSHSQSLSKTKKKATMLHSKESPFSKQQTYNAESQQKIGKQGYGFDSTDRQPIWSSTEPPSPSDTTGMEAPKLSTSTMKSFDSGTQQGSVLARYVERFRHGQPQSREKRQQIDSTEKDEQLSFWWTSSSTVPPSSAPKSTHEGLLKSPLTVHRLPQYDRSPSPYRGSSSILSDNSQCELDTDILQLQERTSRLLQKGDFRPGEESIHVSSDGLACSDFSSPASVDEPIRRPLIPSLLKATTANDSIQAVSPSVIPTLVTPTRPEQDILFQWRLRRKMEKAREWPHSLQHSSQQGSTLGWRGHSQHHPSEYNFMSIHPDLSQGTTHSQISAPLSNTIDQQSRHNTLNSATLPAVVASSTSVSPPQAIAHVPSHMHLLCDILPCPNQSSHTNVEQRLSQRLDPQCNILPQTMQNSDIKCLSHPDPPTSGGTEKDLVYQKKGTEAINKVKAKTKQSEKNEKNTSIPAKEQKKLSGRVYSHQSVSKKAIPSTEQHQQRFTYLNRNSSADEAPPPSPIHSALGQVVSEVLFPSVDLSPAQKISTASLAPSCSASAPTQPAPNPHNSIEVISQLLQEAEDSDESEFEDDPLLQVLRKQRKWVKEQINEVETLLKKFAEEPQKI